MILGTILAQKIHEDYDSGEDTMYKINEKNALYKIAVCSDEASICGQIEQILLKAQGLYNVTIEIEVFLSGEELLKYIKNGVSYDLIFLQSEMSKLNGIKVGMLIRNVIKDLEVELVYVLAKTDDMFKIIKTSPLYAVIKPIKSEEVLIAFKKARGKHETDSKFFYYKLGRNRCKVQLSEIIYFESIGRKAKIVTTQETIEIYDSLTDINKQLEKSNFIRVHKSYIINYDHIAKLAGKQCTMENGEEINISQLKRKEVKNIEESNQLYENYIGSQTSRI